jgi:MFS family permease
MLMSFGMFGSIFLLAQFFQVVQHYSPLQAGLRTLPWTIMPVFVAPLAGLVSSRTGTRPLLVLGMSLMSIALVWMSLVTTPTVEYLAFVPAFIVAGAGMGLFFAPIANVVLSAVRPEEEGKASGANNAIRELGGVFGVAVLASVFASYGSYATGQLFVDGLIPAMRVGAVVVAFGAVAALALGGRTRTVATEIEANASIGELGGAAA